MRKKPNSVLFPAHYYRQFQFLLRYSIVWRATDHKESPTVELKTTSHTNTKFPTSIARRRKLTEALRKLMSTDHPQFFKKLSCFLQIVFKREIDRYFVSCKLLSNLFPFKKIFFSYVFRAYFVRLSFTWIFKSRTTSISNNFWIVLWMTG